MAEKFVDVYDARPSRSCLGCGKTDKAPRDQVTLPDGNAAYYHFDCHVLVANCEVCKDTLAALNTDHTNDGLKDEQLHEKLIDHVFNTPENKRAKIFTTEEAVPQPKTADAE